MTEYGLRNVINTEHNQDFKTEIIRMRKIMNKIVFNTIPVYY